MALTNDDLLAISNIFNSKLKPMKEEDKQIHDELHRVGLLLERDILPRLQNIESRYLCRSIVKN